MSAQYPLWLTGLKAPPTSYCTPVSTDVQTRSHAIGPDVLCAGGFVPGQGAAPPNNAPITFMVTNDCPINGNEYWCGIYGPPGSSKTIVNTHKHLFCFYVVPHCHTQSLTSLGASVP